MQGTPEAAPARGDEAARAETADDQTAYERALRTELDRRIAALAAAPDDAFGGIGLVDGVLTALAFVLLPALIVWLNK